MNSAEAIRAIKERINIVDLVRRYVDLKSVGNRFTAPCPFHQETKPSFSVNPDKGFFYCFGCQATGDIFEFYSKINGLDFHDTLEQLADEAGIVIDSWAGEKDKKETAARISRHKSILWMHELAAKHFIANLGNKNAGECRDYIKRRAIATEIAQSFGIGWAARDWHSLEQYLKKQSCDLDLAAEAGLLGNGATGGFYDRFRGRLIFPIKNLSNQIIAFGGRIIGDEDEAKYINSPDTPIYKKKEHLFGLAQARRGISAKGHVILTEGYMDVLTLHQYGYNNGIGVLGTALTDEQIKRISGFTSKIVMVFDGDKPGRKAAFRSAGMILARGLSCRVVLLPPEDDIDSLLHGKGCEAFDAIKNQALEGLEFCIGVLRDMAPKDAIEWAKNFLSDLTIAGLGSKFASRIAQSLGIDETAIRENFSEKKTAFYARSTIHPTPDQLRNMRDTQIMIYASRYPDRLSDLRELGADLALCSERSKQLWQLIEQWGAEEAIYHMDDKQKQFWRHHRMPPAAPLTDGDEELVCLKKDLDKYYTMIQQASLSAALATQDASSSFEADLEYLRALQETMEKKDEQS